MKTSKNKSYICSISFFFQNTHVHKILAKLLPDQLLLTPMNTAVMFSHFVLQHLRGATLAIRISLRGWSGPKLCNKNFTGSLSHFVPHFWAKPFCRLYPYIYIILYSTQIWSVINPLIILSIVQISTGAKTLTPYRLQHLSSRQYSYVFFPTALLTM